MVRRLLFHLGDPKTGSTSIQHVLASGSFRVPDQRLFYSARSNHIGLAKALQAEASRRDARWQALAERLAGSEADLGVISAEYFASVDPAALDEAIRTHLPEHREEVRLIAYVRPHAERLVSAFAERRKVGLFEGTMERLHQTLLKDGTLTYAPRFAKWRAVFGDAFTLRPMIRAELVGQDVVADFFTWAVGAGEFEITDTRPRNEALSCAELAAMVELHRGMRAIDRKDGLDLRTMRQAFGVNFGRLLSDQEGRVIDRPRLHRALADKIALTYRDDAAALDAAFFEGAPMTRALEAAPGRAIETAQPIEAEAYFGPEARHIFASMSLMLQNFLAADPERFLRAVRGRRTQPVRKDRRPQTDSKAASKSGPRTGPETGLKTGPKGAKAPPAAAKRPARPVPRPVSHPVPGPVSRLGRMLPEAAKRQLRRVLRVVRG